MNEGHGSPVQNDNPLHDDPLNDDPELGRVTSDMDLALPFYELCKCEGTCTCFVNA